jgi:hypothetical protein
LARRPGRAFERERGVITAATLPGNAIIRENPDFEDMTGFSTEEALGETAAFYGRMTTPNPLSTSSEWPRRKEASAG